MQKETGRKPKAIAVVLIWVLRIAVALPIGFVGGLLVGLFKKQSNQNAIPSATQKDASAKEGDVVAASTGAQPGQSTDSSEKLEEVNPPLIDIKGQSFDRCASIPLEDGGTLTCKYYKSLDLIMREISRSGDTPVIATGRIAKVSTRLPDFTKDYALKNQVAFCMTAAQQFTLEHLGAKEKVVIQKSLPSKTLSETKEASLPKVADVAPKAPHEVFEGHVIRMGMVTRNQEGKSPFQTFEVVLRSDLGDEKQFFGVHLKELASKNEFKLRDYIKLEQFKTTESSTSQNGSTNQVKHNKYKVTVMQVA